MTSGRADRQQEDQDDDDRHQQAEQALGGQALDRLLDERRLVEDDGQLRAGGVLQVGQPVPDLVRDLHGVAVRGGGDRDAEAVLAVGPGDRGGRGELLLDRRRRRRAGPGPPAPVARYDAAQVVEGGDRRADLHRRGPAAVGDRAGRHRHAVGLQRGADRGRREPRRGQLRRVRGDHHDCVAGAGHLDRADPVDRPPAPAPRSARSFSASACSSPPPVAASTTAGRSSVLPAMTCGSTPCGQLGVDPAQRGLHLVDHVVEVGAELVTRPGRWPSPRGRWR